MGEMVKAGRGSEQAMIRLPDGMRDEIREAAERNGRSMNAEIVARLSDSFRGSFIEPTTVTGIETQFREMMEYAQKLADALSQSRERENQLVEKVGAMTNALTQATATIQRMMETLEKQQISTKADVRKKA